MNIILKALEQDITKSLRDVKLRQLAFGKYHTAAVSLDGDLYTWGRGIEGQSGLGGKTNGVGMSEIMHGLQAVPRFVGAFMGTRISTVACGEAFTLVLTEQGAIWGFGEALMGQLGQGKCTKQMFPKLTMPFGPNEEPFVSIAAGWAHALAITSSGSLMSWGFNRDGQLGLGDTKTRFYPEQVPDLELYTINAAGNYSCGISGR